MSVGTQQRRSSLGLSVEQSTPRLYDRIIEELRGRHSSRRTEGAYVHWIRRYIELHDHEHWRANRQTGKQGRRHVHESRVEMPARR